jgi:hypothetical protein
MGKRQKQGDWMGAVQKFQQLMVAGEVVTSQKRLITD